MAFKEYRDSCKNSITHELDIERFAYDVFAYILRICGFPEEKIPTSELKDNIYSEDDFVMNVGLSALPIALYSREEWRFTFEEIIGESGIRNILEIQNYLESFIAYSGELEEEDTLSKILYSLALYNEYTLFLNFKGIDTYFDSLPKLWSRLCKELVAQSEDLDESFECSLTMCPDISESWISNFNRNFAIPYGSSNDVSNRFSILSLECDSEENDTIPKERSAEGVTYAVPQVSNIQSPDISEEYTGTNFPEGSDSPASLLFPHVWTPDESMDKKSILEELTHLECDNEERRRPVRYKNGLKYVLEKCRKGRKRSRSQKLEVEDAFGKINLEKENVSPENSDTKRRRRSTGNDKSG